MGDRAAYTEARRVARATASTRRRSLRRQALASRYRDPETGACVTCVAVCECTGGRVLRCAWCKALDGGAS